MLAQENFSACSRATLRSLPLFSNCVIAIANSAPLSLATAPAGFIELMFKISPTALDYDATTGVPLASDSRADRQNVSSGPGAIAISAAAK